MDASKLLWKQWHEQVKQLWVGLHGHLPDPCWRCACWESSYQAVLSYSVSLKGSQNTGFRRPRCQGTLRRLARFVANRRIVVSEVWEQFLEQVLPYWQGKRLFLVLDYTPYGDRACIVYVGLLVQSRVLPLAWRVMSLHEEWDEGQWALLGKLFAQLQPHLASCDCTLIAGSVACRWSSCARLSTGIT